MNIDHTNGRRATQYIRCLLIVGLFVITVVLSAAPPSMVYPNMPWGKEWQQLIDDGWIAPEFKQTHVALPFQLPLAENDNIVIIPLLNEKGARIGFLFVNRSWNTLFHFALDSSDPDVIGVTTYPEVTKDEGQKRVTDFLLKYSPPAPGETMDIRPNENQHADDNAWAYTIIYRYQDIDIDEYHVQINRFGYITGSETGWLSAFHEDLASITPSPGQEHIIASLHAFLQQHGMTEASTPVVKRNHKQSKDGVSSCFWTSSIIVNKDGMLQANNPTYEESTQRWTFSPTWYPTSLPEQKQTLPPSPLPYSRTTHPVWSHDGKQIWGDTESRWIRLPSWYTTSPTSLAVKSVEQPYFSVYRPFLDHSPVSLRYAFPAPSPDGRWLAFLVEQSYVNDTALAVVDLRQNRFYCLPDKFAQIRYRPSWNSDSSTLALVSDDKAYWVSLRNADGFPLQSALQGIPLPSPCLQLEYFPQSRNTLLALCTDVTPSPFSLGKGTLLRITLPDQGQPVTTVVRRYDKVPNLFHICPDGQHCWLAEDDGTIDEMDVNTGEQHPLAWLNTLVRQVERPLPLDFPFPHTYPFIAGRDWAISPDSKDVVVSTGSLDATGYSMYECAMNATTWQKITLNTDIALPRYLLHDTDALVDREQLPVAVLKRFHLPFDEDWPRIQPAGMMMDRLMPGKWVTNLYTHGK